MDEGGLCDAQDMRAKELFLVYSHTRSKKHAAEHRKTNERWNFEVAIYPHTRLKKHIAKYHTELQQATPSLYPR
jgi:hypothetical protein